ncbi:MAG: aminopeptidase [Polyangiaceae bacterium]|nr:aminopeptidase [Polyangiaceae bacterium]
MRTPTRLIRLALAAWSAALLAACAEDEEIAQVPGGQPVDILAALQSVEGLEVAERETGIEGYRYFVLQYDQPADHDHPEGVRFEQRMTLLHRDAAAPFILGTSGYFVIPAFPFLDEPAALLGANQLFVEQRWFSPSRPDPADWSRLTIRQAAADHHRIVEALRPIYGGPWISSGASKGGMASVYHRRFYPDDVAGTVAYVAPQSYGTSDPRYIDFVAQIGDPACGEALRGAQREVLLRRDAMMAKLTAQADFKHHEYSLLGADRALEVAVLELPFTFWQYYGASRCPDVPTAASTDDEVWDFLDEIDPPSFWSDKGFLDYEPYFWQAGVELGYPGLDESHLADLLQFPGIDVPATFVVPGPGKEPVFDPEAMIDVRDWVAAEGRSLLFIYGENDPYSAAAFELGGAEGSFRFFVPGANHGAEILDLEGADRDAALGALEAWTGVTPSIPTAARAPMSLRSLARRRPL